MLLTVVVCPLKVCDMNVCITSASVSVCVCVCLDAKSTSNNKLNPKIHKTMARTKLYSKGKQHFFVHKCINQFSSK